jgi:AraC-like DNA-binding protein
MNNQDKKHNEKGALVMQDKESAKLWRVPHLNDLSLLRANFITYSFKRHAHDYFVIGMVETGVQKFDYHREHYVTPPTGLIVLNPGEAHTGEAAVPSGFRYRALYPETQVLQQIASEIKGRQQDIPFFARPVIHDAALFAEMRRLHIALEATRSPLEHESRVIWTLAQLVQRYADMRPQARPVRREHDEVKQVRRYIEERYTDDIRLDELAALVNWSPFYLLRVFRNEVGLPPHAYLENVRVRNAQSLLKRGYSLVQVAYDMGFNSQSHFTTTFKRLIGVTPGQYAKEVNFQKDVVNFEQYPD